MLEHLIEFDRHLFHIINHDLSNPFFDWLMPLLRNAKTWIPLYVCIIGFCLYKYKKQGAILILLLALSAGIADFTSVHLIKNTVKRLRPCQDFTMSSPPVIVRIPNNACGSGYSFPSTHATDHFAMAAFLTLVFFRKWRWIWAWAFLWAASICFAQVYVGVHYPIDVAAGMLYGILVGTLMALVFKKLQPGF